MDLVLTVSDGNITEGSSISLVCKVDSFPPSTIQWFYKANGTVLLTSPDVLESTYTLTNAGCLDTGLYTCSVRNSVSTTAVTRDIPINVLCWPREDPRINANHNFGLSTSDNITITTHFLANPVPYFTWGFQNTSSVHETELVNGTNAFLTYSSYISTNLSAVSIGIRTNINEHWYGIYVVTATNSQGSGKISFTVNAQGKPKPPYEAAAVCPFPDRAFLSWKSGFDGGSAQTFIVGVNVQADNRYSIDSATSVSDPGQHQTANISISGLLADTQYFFMVYAVNKFGNSTLKQKVSCITKGMHGNVLVSTRPPRRNRYRQLSCGQCQLSDRAERVQDPINGRSVYDQLNTSDVAQASVYSDLGRSNHGKIKLTSFLINHLIQYEMLGRQSHPNFYDDLHSSTPSGDKTTYVNTVIGGSKGK
ncbi:myosin light chain kinase, smooth muscle-like [Argopecten irradians]|uniref:myosin light chain kinase, smooth muscle-like n=1 Tax=Argopecten irradians TaxID=31199 RepID=UPI0037168EE6